MLSDRVLVRPARLPSIHGAGYEVSNLQEKRQCSHDLCSYVPLCRLPASQDIANCPEPAAQQHVKDFVAKDKVNPFNTKINQNKKPK